MPHKQEGYLIHLTGGLTKLKCIMEIMGFASDTPVKPGSLLLFLFKISRFSLLFAGLKTIDQVLIDINEYFPVLASHIV